MTDGYGYRAADGQLFADESKNNPSLKIYWGSRKHTQQSLVSLKLGERAQRAYSLLDSFALKLSRKLPSGDHTIKEKRGQPFGGSWLGRRK